MKTTFLNCHKEDRKNFRKEALKAMQSRAEDFLFWHENGPDLGSTTLNTDTPENYKEAKEEYNNRGSFYDYGLSIEYVAPETFTDQMEGYLRYQLSYGGPSEEVNKLNTVWLFGTLGEIKPYLLTWGTGCGFDVTTEPWAKWLWSELYDTGTVEHEVQKAIEE